MFVFFNIGCPSSIEKERWVVWTGFFTKSSAYLHLCIPPLYFSSFHGTNICEFGVGNLILVLRIQCNKLEVCCFHILRDTNGGRLRRFINLFYLFFI